MVTSHKLDLPYCHGISVHSSTRLFVPPRVKLFGFFSEGTNASIALYSVYDVVNPYTPKGVAATPCSFSPVSFSRIFFSQNVSR